MTKVNLKLLLKKTREAHEETAESQKVPPTREGLGVVKGKRFHDLVAPTPKCQKVQASISSDREGVAPLPMQKDQEAPKALVGISTALHASILPLPLSGVVQLHMLKALFLESTKGKVR